MSLMLMRGVGGGPALPPPAEGAAALVDEDFDYADTAALLANTTDYASSEDVNTTDISLITGITGPPGQGTGKAMRYNFPNRESLGTTTGADGVCSDRTISREIVAPPAGTVPELWWEIWVRFSANFTLTVTSASCTSNPDYKFVFGRVTGGDSRFQLDFTPVQWTVMTPGNSDEGIAGSSIGVVPSSLWDGEWHRFRAYHKVSSDTDVADAAAAWWVAPDGGDDVLIKQYAGIVVNRTSIHGLYLAKNINQGPDIDNVTLDWGRIQIWDEQPAWAA